MLGNADADRVHVAIKDIRPMIRRLHKLLMRSGCTRRLHNVFRDPTESRARLGCARCQRRLARQRMRDRILTRHFLRVPLRGLGEPIVPSQGGQALCPAFMIHRVKESLFRAYRSRLRPCSRTQNQTHDRCQYCSQIKCSHDVLTVHEILTRCSRNCSDHRSLYHGV